MGGAGAGPGAGPGAEAKRKKHVRSLTPPPSGERGMGAGSEVTFSLEKASVEGRRLTGSS